MRNLIILVFATVLFAAEGSGQTAEQIQVMRQIQQSHIDANVPDSKNFRAFLERDLIAYFRNSGSLSATSVEYRLLRDGPTQTGISYPKYYAWVKVFTGPKILQEGAARLAAVDRTHFEITHFLSKQEIKANPGQVRDIFPAPLVTNVLSLAGLK